MQNLVNEGLGKVVVNHEIIKKLNTDNVKNFISDYNIKNISVENITAKANELVKIYEELLTDFDVFEKFSNKCRKFSATASPYPR